MNAIEWLESLGFTRMTGTDDVVYTNANSHYVSQVWVLLSGDFDGFQTWDATEGLDCEAFFKWWSRETYDKNWQDSRYD
jgi:hypothetical protein